MNVSVDIRKPIEADTDLLALAFTQFDSAEHRLAPRIAAIDRAMDGGLSAALASGDFAGKPGQTLALYPDGAISAKRVLLLGLGEESALDCDALRRAAAAVVGQAGRRHAGSACLVLPSLRRLRTPAMVEAIAEGAVLAAYRFDGYRETGKDAPGIVRKFSLSIDRAADLRSARAAARTGVILAESQNVARDLSNEPANELPPIALARRAQRVGREVGLKVKVMDVAEMKRRKMGAILAVGQGSVNPPRMIVMEHNAPGRGRKQGARPPTICLVGKGITFDSGGISIKPGAAMDEMKHDMSGAAAVVGAMRACALLKLPLHVVGVIAAAENLPSGTAYRPGDVIRAMSGKTIEVLNTDAEGRVVLADALHYARTEYRPAAMVDLATLTGACLVALGKWASGLFGNHDGWREHILAAGEATAERVWPLPLWKEHSRHIKSQIADIKNVGGRDAGSSTAAAFLENFVGDTPWVHLDIAGTAWTSATSVYQPRGATGVGVRLLLEALRTWRDRAPV